MEFFGVLKIMNNEVKIMSWTYTADKKEIEELFFEVFKNGK